MTTTEIVLCILILAGTWTWYAIGVIRRNRQRQAWRRIMDRIWSVL